ncbi:MCP methyltransferase, CheR-type [Syntrophobotulus glycolicus DSM 8271]|uniref:MCP methyltransferase, CheR-type n=1 Tax=Syntrophobotulus glycolicus (strain DSM 8271 / FlGlyR) TaxID=645991 RepID=F0SX69_SYNGF|nr:protein-glutamate O-methyltransferase CheR [Syntrophobotulus glycolicus]ADY56929.1 MCP methyltransferase, CheR-type [Syntrophobotulus glycolicus DSM 8271]
MHNSPILTYEQFIKAFLHLSGLDLNYYKENQMRRRINAFMNNNNFQENYHDFTLALKRDPLLFDSFFKHLTINVSQFFRDQRLWDILRTTILPLIVNNRPSVRLWSAGCSSGQEAYSLGIMMQSSFPQVKYNILASDIDVNVLKHAQNGLYEERDFISTPPEFLEKYFTQSNGKYQIKEIIKKNVRFVEQNLLTDRFDSGFDFIACRNVVIYFTDEAKEILYKKFIASLNPGGILFTGSTEHLFGYNLLGLKPIASFFYQKKEKTG